MASETTLNKPGVEATPPSYRDPNNPQLRDPIIRNRIPINSCFEITYRCNLKCRHCLVDRSADELSLGQVEYVLDCLRSLGSIYLTITGGEPFVREDLFGILRAAQKRKFATRIYSNGTLIDEAVVKELTSIGRQYLEISFMAANAETCEAITGSTTAFDRVCKAIRMLRNDNHVVVTKSSLMGMNFDERHEVPRLAEELGSIFRGFDPVIQPGISGGTHPLEVGLSYDQVLKFYIELLEERGTTKGIDPLSWDEYINKKRYFCFAALGAIGVAPDGTMLPCIGGRIGANLFKPGADPHKIWREHPAFLCWLEKDCVNMKGCENCDDVSFCSRCAGVSLQVHGEFRRVDSYCMLAKALHEAWNIFHARHTQ